MGRQARSMIAAMSVGGFSRSTLGICMAAALAAGCGGSQLTIPASTTLPQSVWNRQHAEAKTTLIVTEQDYDAAKGAPKGGLIEIYTSPFSGPPVQRRIYTPNNAVLAPNGALVVTTAMNGAWVYDTPSAGKPRLLRGPLLPTGQTLFDAQGRLFVPDQDVVWIFDPPYGPKPSLLVTTPAGISDVALDKDGDLFVGPRDVSSHFEECLPPDYTKCKNLMAGLGALAVTGAGDLLVGLGNGELGEFPPPFRKSSAKTRLLFDISELAVGAGAVFAAGLDSDNSPNLGVFVSSIKRHMRNIPVGDDFNPWMQFSVAKNRDLFVSKGSYQHPCVRIYRYPYDKQHGPCVPVSHVINSVFAQ